VLTSGDALPSHWNLDNPNLIAETFSSRIWRVKREDGSSAVVKALKPFDDVEDELRGAHYLRWRDGNGAVRLYDMHDQAMLLEDAGDRLLAAELAERSDNDATEIAAEVMARLFSPSDRPYPTALQPLRQRFRSLFSKAASDRPSAKRSLYVEAAAIADRLLDNPVAVAPLHGDLHHDNVLFGPRGWLAIDPKGVLGDPGFDAANWLYNPLDRDDLCQSPDRIAFMAERFGKTLNQAPTAILDHALAYGCLSASWHAEDGNTKDEERELSIAQAIRSVRVSF